jgi:tetratricopeptide (TPR) repeat protein
MGRVAIVAILVLLLLCAGGVVLAGYGGFEFWRVNSAATEVEEAEESAAQEAAEEVVAGKERCAEGHAALEARAYDAALVALDACVLASPGEAGPLIDRGQVYARTDLFERAEADLEKAVGIDGSRVDAWETLAWVRVRLGDDTRAIEALDHWIALRPDNGEAYRMRADAHYRAGDRGRAVEDANRSCNLGNPDGCTLEERLRRR